MMEARIIAEGNTGRSSDESKNRTRGEYLRRRCLLSDRRIVREMFSPNLNRFAGRKYNSLLACGLISEKRRWLPAFFIEVSNK